MSDFYVDSFYFHPLGSTLRLNYFSLTHRKKKGLNSLVESRVKITLGFSTVAITINPPENYQREMFHHFLPKTKDRINSLKLKPPRLNILFDEIFPIKITTFDT